MKIIDFSYHNQRHNKLMAAPAPKNSVSFDRLYDEISDQWEDKARRLQARRWRKIKHQAI